MSARRDHGRARGRVRRGRACRRRREAARPADPRPRTRRHPLRHGLPAAAEPPQRRRAARTTSTPILATGKHVVVIGGGDTGSDCIGTSNRQGALSVTQIEIMPMPPEKENKALIWPNWPLKLRTSSSQEEGVDRDFAVATVAVRRRGRPGHGAELRPRRRALPADPRHRVRAQGRPGAARHGLPRPGAGRHGQAVRRRARQARQRPRRHPRTTRPPSEKVFSCGDMRRGQSLVVWAIREGRQCARSIDLWLMGRTDLPR